MQPFDTTKWIFTIIIIIIMPCMIEQNESEDIDKLEISWWIEQQFCQNKNQLRYSTVAVNYYINFYKILIKNKYMY